MTVKEKRHIIKNHIKMVRGTGRCADCRCRHRWDRSSCFLTFHHRDPKTKKFTIGDTDNYDDLTLEEVITEIAKCILLCTICHQDIHRGET